jgi:hypothetical protein
MKFLLRFFLHYDDPEKEQFCFATFRSGYVPSYGDSLFLGDDYIDKKVDGITYGGIYQVKQKVFVYNNDEKEDDLTSVEITVVRTNP